MLLCGYIVAIVLCTHRCVMGKIPPVSEAYKALSKLLALAEHRTITPPGGNPDESRVVLLLTAGG